MKHLIFFTIVLTFNYSYNMNGKINFECDYYEYKNVILSIESKVIDLTSLNDLLRIEEFINLTNEYKTNFNCAIKYLQDSSNSQQQKIISIYSLKNVPYDDYITYLSQSIKSFKKGIISEEILMIIIFPGKDWNCSIIGGYKNVETIDLLNSIKSNEISNELNYIIDNTLNGILYRDIKEGNY